MLKNQRIVSVIDIGSTACRMVVLEIQADGSYQRLDRASKPITLGRDVFISKTIRSESMMQVISILSGFAELLRTYKLKPQDCFAVATSAVREARNRDTFVDRVRIKTGFDVKIVDGVEENHLTYIAVLHAMENIRGSLTRANSMIMEVGGGSTELMIIHRGKMQAAQSLKVGTVRVDQQLRTKRGSEVVLEEFLREQFRLSLTGLHSDTDLRHIRYFIMVGGDARIAAYNIGRAEGEHYSVLNREDFLKFIEDLQQKTVDEIVRDLRISYSEAEGLVPALLIYKLFLVESSAQELIVPDVSIRDGILLNNVIGKSASIDRNFARQVLASAHSLASRYNIDEDHSEQVTKLSLELFDNLMDEHGLGHRERLYLAVAAILHDVGYFISQSGHHKHGRYIVSNSEVFGLSYDELQVVSTVIRYHRGAKPVRNHPEYGSMSRDERLIVNKLAAILRVADALDRGHSRHIRDISLEIQNNRLYITANQSGDISAERDGISQKAGMFEDVFGYKVILK